jgi:hypothetical protein
MRGRVDFLPPCETGNGFGELPSRSSKPQNGMDSLAKQLSKIHPVAAPIDRTWTYILYGVQMHIVAALPQMELCSIVSDI